MAFVAASLLHHAHNAEYLEHYPNLPAWISRHVVFLSLYGFYGLDSLVHYALAPASAHTLAMNISIGLETATAGILLASILVTGLRNRTAGPG